MRLACPVLSVQLHTNRGPALPGTRHSWSGLGLIIAGMTHQGWDVQLTAYAARERRATFFPVVTAHSIAGRSVWEPTPWRAVHLT
jgi:hypothetical protein